MIREILFRFFEGSASDEDILAVKTWLEEREEHKSIFLEERQMFDALLFHSEELLQEDLATDMQSSKGYRYYLTNFLKVAAIVLATLLCMNIYNTRINDQLATRMQTISVPAGQRIHLVLPDSTTVWLNAQSTLKYPVDFSGGNREIYLDGEAYFVVSKDKEMPFVVGTTKGEVKVLGTEFNMKAYADEAVFETALLEGSVEITLKEDPNNPLLLQPNTKAVLNQGKLEVVQIEDHTKYTWRDGLISFRNESIYDVFKMLEKSYDITVDIKDRQEKPLFITGKFRLSDGPDYALKVLQRNASFTYDRHSNKYVIYMK